MNNRDYSDIPTDVLQRNVDKRIERLEEEYKKQNSGDDVQKMSMQQSIDERISRLEEEYKTQNNDSKKRQQQIRVLKEYRDYYENMKHSNGMHM